MGHWLNQRSKNDQIHHQRSKDVLFDAMAKAGHDEVINKPVSAGAVVGSSKLKKSVTMFKLKRTEDLDELQANVFTELSVKYPVNPDEESLE